MAALAAGSAVATAALGALPSARKAKMASAMDLLAEARSPSRRLGRARVVAGIVLVGGSVALLLAPPTVGDFQNTTIAASVMAIAGLVFLAPALLPALAKLGAQVAKMLGPSLELGASHAGFAAKRTTSLATPIVLFVGLVSSLFMIAQTSLADQLTTYGQDVKADVVIEASDAAALPTDLESLVSTDQSVAAAAILQTSLGWEADGASTDAWVGWANLQSLQELVSIKVLHGTLDDVTGDHIATTDTDKKIGDQISLRSPDGQSINARVAAVVEPNGILLHDAIFAPDAYPYLAKGAHWKGWALTGPGSDPQHTSSQITKLIQPAATAVTKAQWLKDGASARRANQTTGLICMVGAAAIMVLFVIVSTCLAAQRERRLDYERLIALGATRSQISRSVIAESGYVIALALALIAAILIPSAARLTRMLVHIGSAAQVQFPAIPLLVMSATAACAALGASYIGSHQQLNHLKRISLNPRTAQ